MIRIVCFLRAIVVVPILLVWTIINCFLMMLNAIVRRRAYADWVKVFWARFCLWWLNIRVHTDGLENLPEGGCLFVFNHTSHIDIMVTFLANPKSTNFGAKIELFSIPLFAGAMRAAGVLPISRADRTKTLKLYDESIARVHAGESFYLAGEGTRQARPGVGEKLKAGPFIFAINGQFPIVPLVLQGVGEALPTHHILPCLHKWRYDVRVRFLKPVVTQGRTLDEREILQIETREMMAKAYQELEHLGLAMPGES